MQNFDPLKTIVACKSNKKTILLHKTLDFVVAKYVRMWNFVVAKIIVVFKNQKNRVITKTLETHPYVIIQNFDAVKTI